MQDNFKQLRHVHAIQSMVFSRDLMSVLAACGSVGAGQGAGQLAQPDSITRALMALKPEKPQPQPRAGAVRPHAQVHLLSPVDKCKVRSVLLRTVNCKVEECSRDPSLQHSCPLCRLGRCCSSAVQPAGQTLQTLQQAGRAHSTACRTELAGLGLAPGFSAPGNCSASTGPRTSVHCTALLAS